MNYLLITPLRNESKYVENIVNQITSQTLKPSLWLIIENESDDNTPMLLKRYLENCKFAVVLKENFDPLLPGHLNFSKCMKAGYNYIQKNYREEYAFIGKIDADIKIPENFFEELIKYSILNPNTAAVSGIMLNLDEKRNLIKKENYLPDEIPDIRIYSRKFLEEVDGFPISKYSPDTVMLIKARINGWEIKTLNGLLFYHLREVRNNLWEKNKNMGKSRYYLNYNPIIIIMNSMFCLKNNWSLNCLGILIGYVSSFLKREEKIKDSQIKKYFFYTRPKQIIKLYLKI